MVFFSGGKGGGEAVDYGYKGKGVTTHLLVDAFGQPLAVTCTGASGEERRQVAPLLSKISGWLKPLISRGITPILEADKGYDAEWLRLQILAEKLFPYIPYRQFGVEKEKRLIKVLEKYRWKVERGISWLQRKYRRVVIRWERRMKYWEGFLTLGILVYWLRQLALYGYC